ncbi:MAG: M14 family zinc carboxypeptidase [Bacteroidota bacterium]
MKNLISFLFLLLFITSVHAQKEWLQLKRFAFEPELAVNASIPTPASFLGYELGEQSTYYSGIENYIKALSNNSNRLKLINYGKTYENRSLYLLVFSSPENLSNLESIRNNHLKLMTANESQARDILEKEPVFLSLSYNIHGNETSTSEAALQVAYRLAAATDEATLKLLQQSVIQIYVCINPDGRERYIQWYNSVRRKQLATSKNDLEHYEPAPNGRTNHYWFDVNRDWSWGIHPETRELTAEYQKWMPQIHVDHHEQGYNSNYFTMPGTTPRNKILPPTYEAWSDTFGRANINAFNKNDISYFTREAFDFFYPGYGSSYPSVMGAIAMLTEQGGIAGGRAIETEDGTILTLRQRIWDHYTTSVQSLFTGVKYRRELLKYSYDAWQPATSLSENKCYFLSPSDIYTPDVIRILQHHGVKFEQSKEAFTVNNAFDYVSNIPQRKNYPKGTIILSCNQPQHLLINSVMDKTLEIEDSVMYDMAIWALPIAYNLNASYTKENISIPTEALSMPVTKLNVLSDAYAYVIDWKQRNAPAALAHLWKLGYRVRSSTKAFQINNQTFSPGTLIILSGANLEKKESFKTDFQQISQIHKIAIHAVSTGRAQDGFDLGSSKNRPVQQPRVALMVDAPFNMQTAGQVWFLFDEEVGLPVDRIRSSILLQSSMPKFGERYGYADLNDYDVLILPGGGNNLRYIFDKDAFSQLQDWVNRGGVLIALENAVEFFTQDRSKFTSVRWSEMPADTTLMAKTIRYDQREDYFGKKRIPGSALFSHIDTSNPLAFGMESSLHSLKQDVSSILPGGGIQVVGSYHNDPSKLLTGGYASKESLKQLSGKCFAGVMPMGAGKVVFLLDNTQFRMFWRGPSRMIQNAVMLLNQF